MSLCRLFLNPQLFDLFLYLTLAGDKVLLLFPLGFESIRLLADLSQLLINCRQTIPGIRIVFFLQGLLFYFKLRGTPLQLINLGRHGVDLNPQGCRGFINQIDSLVRQKALRYVTMRQRRSRHDRGVLDSDAVVHFVALFQAAQNCDCVFNTRLADIHNLKAPLQRSILLDVFPVFVQRGGANGAQLTTCQSGLQHVRRINGAFGGTGADKRVQLIDEEDNLSLGIFNFLKNGL